MCGKICDKQPENRSRDTLTRPSPRARTWYVTGRLRQTTMAAGCDPEFQGAVEYALEMVGEGHTGQKVEFPTVGY